VLVGKLVHDVVDNLLNDVVGFKVFAKLRGVSFRAKAAPDDGAGGDVGRLGPGNLGQVLAGVPQGG